MVFFNKFAGAWLPPVDETREEAELFNNMCRFEFENISAPFKQQLKLGPLFHKATIHENHLSEFIRLLLGCFSGKVGKTSQQEINIQFLLT